MSGGSALSAVARRRARIEAAAAATPDFPPKLDDNAGASVEANPPTSDVTSSLPLKRKSSSWSLKQNGISGSQTTESRSRKKLRAPQYASVTPATEEPVSPDYPRKRPYSPSQPLDVSSDEEGSTPPVLETPGVALTRNIPGLTEGENYFKLPSEDAYSVTGRRMAGKVVILNEGESLIFVGTMEFTLLQGSIRLLGTTVTPSKIPHRIFAPRSHPIPVLDALNQLARPDPQKSGQERSGLISALPAHIAGSITSSHVVMVFQEMATGVEGLGRVVPAFGGIFEPDAREKDITERILESAYIYRSESQFDTSFHFPDDWQEAIASILSFTPDDAAGSISSHLYDTPVVLVKGAKNSGKSTFARSLANSLTSRYHEVAFIECDLGQSEFTPGGMVSLNLLKAPVFGPPFTHPNRPVYAHFIGGNSPKMSPSHYLAALGDLAQRYQLELKYSETIGDDSTDDAGLVRNANSVPLVINTQGWVKGMGAGLLRSIEELFAPTHVVEFQLPYISSSLEPFHSRPVSFSEDPGQNLSNAPRRSIKLLPVPPSPRSPRFSAADLRSLALASYFYGRSSRKDSDNDSGSWITHWDTSLSLRSTAPIAIDIHAALESIVISAPAGDDVVPADLPRALVCGIVGLIAPDSPSTPPETLYTQGGLPPSPQNSRCIGLGFVRGASATHLHLLTPAPNSQLKLCRMLVIGELTMPVWAFLEHEGSDIDENGLPFLQWGRSIAEDAGGERRRIRRNIMRRGQI